LLLSFDLTRAKKIRCENVRPGNSGAYIGSRWKLPATPFLIGRFGAEVDVSIRVYISTLASCAKPTNQHTTLPVESK